VTTTTFKPRVGARLKNGALILSVLTNGDCERLVLGDWSNSDRSQRRYATWRIDDEGNASSGHYFSDLAEAAKDLTER
jgi:hypothetical protein